MLAYSWRIANGEVPYRDFIYVRTPLTPYVHTLWLLLPDGWQIPAGRLAFYLELALSGALPALWLVSRGLRATPRALFLAAIGSLAAAHNFPPMPWPTVDGLALASGAFTAWLFSRERRGGSGLALIAVASALVALAALAKQSYGLLAPLFVIAVAGESFRDRAWSRVLAAVFPGTAIALMTVGLIAAASALPDFVQQITSPMQLRPRPGMPWTGDFFVNGVQRYLDALVFPLPFFVVAAFITAYIGDGAGRRRAAARWVGLTILSVFLAVLAVELRADPPTAGRWFYWTFIAAGSGYALRALRAGCGRGDIMAMAGAAVLAYAASLSFASYTPLLGLAPAGLFLLRALPQRRWPAEPISVALVTALVAAAVLSLNLDVPYRDLPREMQTANLGAVYPRLGVLFTNESNYARFAELRELSRRYAQDTGRPFVVMPEYPLVYFLSGVRNPVSIDWFQPQEYVGNEDRLRAELLGSGAVVIVARQPEVSVADLNFVQLPCRRAAIGNELVDEVLATWTIAAEGRAFCVYHAP